MASKVYLLLWALWVLAHTWVMSTRPYREVRDRLRASWDDETRALHAEASSYFEEIARRQIELGEDFAQARKAMNLTQKELEVISGIDQAEISRLENGHNATQETLIKVSIALKRKVALV